MNERDDDSDEEAIPDRVVDEGRVEMQVQVTDAGNLILIVAGMTIVSPTLYFVFTVPIAMDGI